METEETDGALLERFARLQDQKAFEALVHRQGPMVLGVCQRILNDPHAAEDAFQATFFLLAQKAKRVSTMDSIAGWLHGVAVRIALRAKSRTFQGHVRELQRGSMASPNPEPDQTWTRMRPLLDEELSRLPEKYRSPLVLCYLEGKTNEGAAEELGWPAGTMSRRLARARDLLRDRLVRRGVTVTGAVLGTLILQKAASAAVPSAVAASTASLATLIVAGQGAAAVGISPQVAALVKGGLNAMFLAKAKVAAAVVLTVSALGTGIGMGATRLTQPPAQVQPGARMNPALADLAGNTWVKLRPARNPVGRSYSGICYGGGYLFYFGGGHGSYPGNDVELYDVAANTWIQATEMEDWREYKKWTHLTEDQKKSIPNIGGGSNAFGVTSPRGRPLTLHTYQMHCWYPEEKAFYNMVRGLGMWAFDPVKREWKEINKSIPVMNDVHTGGLFYDPELKTLIAVVSSGNDNGVWIWDNAKKSFARKAECPSRDWSEVYQAFDASRKVHVIRSGKRWWTLSTPSLKTRVIADLPIGDSTAITYDPDTRTILCLKKDDCGGKSATVWAYDGDKDGWSEVKLSGTAPAGEARWGLMSYDSVHKCHLVLNVVGVSGQNTDGVFAFRHQKK